MLYNVVLKKSSAGVTAGCMLGVSLGYAVGMVVHGCACIFLSSQRRGDDR